uniref:DUF629 domain-containing protein n=1 Tax=Oryza brachyantha TaxID=4533 RepID=J3N9F9_ORYBR
MGRGSRAQRKEAAAAAVAGGLDDESRALRKEAAAALRMSSEDGRYDEAIARAEELAARHPGVLRRPPAALGSFPTPGGGGGPPQPPRGLSPRAYGGPQGLASNCVEIATSLAMARFVCLNDDCADVEIIRAMRISSPTDPAENNVAYDLVDGGGSTTVKERIANAKAAASSRYNEILAHVFVTVIPRAVRDLLDIAKRDGAAKEVKPAKALAERYSYSSRALFAHAHMDVQFARGLAPGIDKRPFLDRLLSDLNKQAHQFDTSLVLAMFRAKLLFLLDMHLAAEVECNRALYMKGAADPSDEDVPLGSVPGENSEEREFSIRIDLGRLLQKIVLASKDYWYSLPSEKQDSFLFVGFNSMHQHYAKNYEVEKSMSRLQTISDAISLVKKCKSWRFWICPYCVGKKNPDIDSLFQHLRNKHAEGNVWPKLQSVLDPKSISSTSQGDCFLDDVTMCQDLKENYV